MIRHATSLIAATALVFAVAVPPASACESATVETSGVAATMTGSSHSMDGATQSDCPESGAPASQEHDSNCLATCVSMMGCSSTCFVGVGALTMVVDHEAVAPTSIAQPHLSRSRAPDRPPPRV
jgi:hypothetical protein